MNIKVIKIKNPDSLNLIFGQSHFIKTVEDLHEIIVSNVPQAKFGLAFAEASGPCLIRTSGTNKELEELAAENILAIGAGHTFLIFLKDSFPINFLPAIKNVPEVVRLFCATANSLEVIVYETKQGRGVLGVVDGFNPKGIEKPRDVKARKEFIRKIGYKL